MHQSKVNLEGTGVEAFGYGPDDKVTNESRILESVYVKASAESRDSAYIEGVAQTLASIVPEIVKKPGKPVNAATALTLACRRRQDVDEKGVL